MARKPNYNFERKERERIRAQKKADRQRTKEARIEARKATTVEAKEEAQSHVSGHSRVNFVDHKIGD